MATHGIIHEDRLESVRNPLYAPGRSV